MIDINLINILFLIMMHVLLTLIVLTLTLLHVIKTDIHLALVMIWIPFWGPICILAINIMMALGKVGNKEKDLEAMRMSELRTKSLPSRVTESEYVIPLEDALIIDDAKVRRTMIMDVLMEDSQSYSKVLSKARTNDDVEVVHYATTAMAEMSKDYELQQQKYSTDYAKNPDNDELRENYIAFLEKYIGSGTLQGQLLDIERVTYQSLLRTQVKRKNRESDVCRLIASDIDSKNFEEAEKLLDSCKERWPKSDDLWMLNLRYSYEAGLSDRLRQLIDARKMSDTYSSKEVRDIIEFWEKVR